jgi:glyoxylase-like metal-dependent hydrolase (beta-lactamase superfamily II)
MTDPKRWTVGNVRLTPIVEAETAGIPVEFFFPTATGDDVARADWLTPGSADGSTIAFRVQSFVLERLDEHGRRDPDAGLVVVDPCVGNHKQRNLAFWNMLDTSWFDDFEAAGFAAADVTIVVHTHLHEDHIGWDTHLVDGVWQPTFANARHVYVGDELDFAERDDRRVGHDPFADSIKPVLDAGLGWEVDATAEIAPGIRLVPSPGHTPGHVSMIIDTGAEPLAITGDALHHQFQFTNPSIAEVADIDIPLAQRSRSELFDDWAATGAVVAGTHFAVEPVGVVSTHDGAWRFDPVSAD